MSKKWPAEGKGRNRVDKIDEVVKNQQNDGFDVGASCGRPCPGERSSPLSRVSRDNDEVEAQSRSERETFYETINYGLCISFSQGVIKRALSPFPAALDAFQRETDKIKEARRSPVKN